MTTKQRARIVQFSEAAPPRFTDVSRINPGAQSHLVFMQSIGLGPLHCDLGYSRFLFCAWGHSDFPNVVERFRHPIRVGSVAPKAVENNSGVQGKRHGGTQRRITVQPTAGEIPLTPYCSFQLDLNSRLPIRRDSALNPSELSSCSAMASRTSDRLSPMTAIYRLWTTIEVD
jgi:hypothetical protein